jgi:hypothetical protein
VRIGEGSSPLPDPRRGHGPPIASPYILALSIQDQPRFPCTSSTGTAFRDLAELPQLSGGYLGGNHASLPGEVQPCELPSVAPAAPGVGERLALHGDKEPIITFRVEGKLQYTLGVIVVDLAVG